MKTLKAPLGLAFALILTGCQDNFFDGGAVDKCQTYAVFNMVTLRFDGSVLMGKKFQIRSDGRLVYDSCNPGAYNGVDRMYVPIINGPQSEIRELISKEISLPMTENMEILSRGTCAVAPVSVGTAYLSYTYTYHPEDKACEHDYHSEEQTVVFR
jgi:hypothetical protein